LCCVLWVMCCVLCVVCCVLSEFRLSSRSCRLTNCSRWAYRRRGRQTVRVHCCCYHQDPESKRRYRNPAPPLLVFSPTTTGKRIHNSLHSLSLEAIRRFDQCSNSSNLIMTTMTICVPSDPQTNFHTCLPAGRLAHSSHFSAPPLLLLSPTPRKQTEIPEPRPAVVGVFTNNYRQTDPQFSSH